MSDYVRQHAVESVFSEGESWVVLSEIERSIKRKIETVGVPLREWNISINYGVKTGCNDAFVVNGVTKDQLIAEDSRSAEIIRPILRGRDIKRYSYTFADQWLIATFPARHYDINEFPAIKRYLQSYGERRLAQTGEKDIDGIKGNNARKRTSNKWFETQDTIAYWDDLDKQKIIWGELSDLPKFALDIEGRFAPLNTAFLMTGESLGYLTAFLNSPVSKYYFSSNIATSSGVGTIRWLKYTIETLPVPIAPKEVANTIERMVKTVSRSRSAEQQTKEIDTMIYNLYGFTNDEISFIEQLAGF